METRLTEVADGVHQLTTHISEMDFSFNQYFVNGEEPLLFHTGGRGLFPLVSEAVGRVTPIDSLRWITFGSDVKSRIMPRVWPAIARTSHAGHSVGLLQSSGPSARSRSTKRRYSVAAIGAAS